MKFDVNMFRLGRLQFFLQRPLKNLKIYMQFLLNRQHTLNQSRVTSDLAAI